MRECELNLASGDSSILEVLVALETKIKRVGGKKARIHLPSLTFNSPLVSGKWLNGQNYSVMKLRIVGKVHDNVKSHQVLLNCAPR